MNVLSLFSGAGGGDLAITHLLGHRIVGYVEIDDFCQRILAQRIKDGIMHNAPIYSDIGTFIDQGFADAYQGMVDCISAGFPCQPFSAAGKRLGGKDERNMWPQTIECIRVVRPHFAFLENVPALLSSGYFGRILGDLAEAGYDTQWIVLSADDCGAPHERKRLWMLAYSNKNRCDWKNISLWAKQEKNFGIARSGAEISNPMCKGLAEPEMLGSVFFQEKREKIERGCVSYGGWRRGPADDAESGLGRMVNGVAYRVDRIKAIGNGQVPAVAATAWNILMEIEP